MCGCGTWGGTITTASGEFTITLRKEHGPGDEIAVDVQGWVVVSPYDGRVFVPKQGSVAVVVAKKGDAGLLDREYMTRLVQDAVTQVPAQSTQALRPPDGSWPRRPRRWG